MDVTAREALFAGERPLPALPSCEHVAGTEKTMRRSLALQRELALAFDVTLDLEDGAPVGAEEAHARLVAALVGEREPRDARVGVRVHDPSHPAFRIDLDLAVRPAAAAIAYVTIPKCTSAAQARRAIQELHEAAGRPLPVHLLVETHGALREVHQVAALPSVETLDFGLMDFVSAHRGAIPLGAMRSPGQFDHPLVRRAKLELVAAAIGAGVVPAHNVTIQVREPGQAAADAGRARGELGFLRMWSIHPSQIAPIVEAFAPRHDEVEHSASVLRAAAAARWAPISFEGHLQDRASFRLHFELLDRARVAGVALPQDVAALLA